jgi:hypothetical protein
MENRILISNKIHQFLDSDPHSCQKVPKTRQFRIFSDKNPLFPNNNIKKIRLSRVMITIENYSETVYPAFLTLRKPSNHNWMLKNTNFKKNTITKGANINIQDTAQTTERIC